MAERTFWQKTENNKKKEDRKNCGLPRKKYDSETADAVLTSITPHRNTKYISQIIVHDFL